MGTVRERHLMAATHSSFCPCRDPGARYAAIPPVLRPMLLLVPMEVDVVEGEEQEARR